MNAYATYLTNRLKEFGATQIVIRNLLVNENGKLIWCEDHAQHCAKFSILGINGQFNGFISNTSTKYGDAILFANNWDSSIDEKHSIDDPALLDSKTLESMFMQMMALNEKRNIWLAGEKLFEKGRAYEYMMNAELTFS